MTQLWIQSAAGRAWAAGVARARELRRLARRAGCSLDEAQRHRTDGERFCGRHGWYATALCLPCKDERRRARRKAVSC